MKFASIFFTLAIGGNTVDSASSTAFSANDKHPLEDRKSWDLHVTRQLAEGVDAGRDDNIDNANVRRFLQAVVDSPPEDEDGDEDTENENDVPLPYLIKDEDTENENKNDVPLPYSIKDEDTENENKNDVPLPYSIEHKKPRKHIPFAGGDTTHGIMIDAGSQGTRLHIYEWDKRFLLDEDDLLQVAHGKKLSYPTSNNRWTDKYTPGLDVFGYHKNPEKLEQAVGDYLGSFLDFAKDVLKDKKDEWHNYPIYLKATGGLRTLPKLDRVRLMDCVRKLFHNETYNPFAFEDERARVISGEEEAIYGWVGVNFAKSLLIDQSVGTGLGNNPQLTYGMLEMGGASTQIAVYENNGDLMANLFKLQLGGARHWNVYVHSYLYSGINGAWSRLNARLHWEGTSLNPCLPTGSDIEFSSWMQMNEKAQFYPRSHPESIPYSVTMVNNHTDFDFQRCSDLSYALLRKETNEEWCDFQMDDNCGFAGIYQPPLPKVNKDIDEFVATSNFVDVYQFLQLGERSTISNIGKTAEEVCSLSFEELKVYNANLKSPIDDDSVLAEFCFRSVFVYQLLRNGWEFGDDYVMTAADVINGQKMGWALGCMLYEINTLPWDFHPELLYRGPSWYLISLYIALGTLAGSAVGFIVAMRMSKKFNKAVRESKFFQNSGIANNSVLRKSMAIPDFSGEFDELEKLYEDDEKEANENEALAKQNAGLNAKYT